MTNSPTLSDSPQCSDHPLVQTESSHHVPFPTVQHGETRVSESSENSEGTSSDKLSALPGEASPSSDNNRANRAERHAVPPSPSVPLLPVSPGGRPFPSSDHDALKATTSEGSLGRGSPQQRVSFEGNRNLSTTPSHSHSPRSNVHVHPLLREAITNPLRGIDSTMARMPHSSDPPRPPSVVRVAGVSSSRKASYDSPISASASHSRAASPMRIFNWSGFHRTHSREDPFVPVDPFQLRTRLRRFSFHSPDLESGLSFDPTCDDNPFCCLLPLTCSPKDRLLSFLRNSRYFLIDTLPRQIYLHLLLRLPSLYFSRIARVYEDAQLSKPDLDRMIECYSGTRQNRPTASSPVPPGAHFHPGPALPFPEEWSTTNVPPALIRFKHSWEAFIDSLLREWKTLNLVSALLLSAILSMFQNQEMADDPLTRTAALLSLTCALMSLSYGCVYIVRFGTMRSMYKATRWAEEAGRTTTIILWNVWVLLAMPAVWLAWSMIFFITAILSFVWRSGSTSDPASPMPLSPTAILGPRIVVSSMFLLGLVYFAAIVKTLHNYGRVRGDERRVPASGPAAGGNDESEIGREREREREDRGREPTRNHRGRERARREGRGRDRDHERGPTTDQGGLSAVMGLGLTGLDSFASPRSSDEMPIEKPPALGSI